MHKRLSFMPVLFARQILSSEWTCWKQLLLIPFRRRSFHSNLRTYSNKSLSYINKCYKNVISTKQENFSYIRCKRKYIIVALGLRSRWGLILKCNTRHYTRVTSKIVLCVVIFELACCQISFFFGGGWGLGLIWRYVYSESVILTNKTEISLLTGREVCPLYRERTGQIDATRRRKQNT